MMADSFELLLARLFDYQRFAQNPRLATLLSRTASRYPNPLEDEDLELVSAAGEPGVMPESGQLPGGGAHD